MYKYRVCMGVLDTGFCEGSRKKSCLLTVLFKNARTLKFKRSLHNIF